MNSNFTFLQIERQDTHYCSSSSTDDNESKQHSESQVLNINKIKKTKQITPTWQFMQLKSISSTPHNTITQESRNKMAKISTKLRDACMLRDKWLYTSSPRSAFDVGETAVNICLNVKKMKRNFPKSLSALYTLQFSEGVMHIYHKDTKQEPKPFCVPSLEEYFHDLAFIQNLIECGPLRSFCYKRLKLLELKFDIHLLLNSGAESNELKSIPHRDFYNVRKVDNHIHHSASMNQKYLLNFIKTKYQNDYHKVVWKPWNSDQTKTLGQVFNDLNLNVKHLSLNQLDVHAQQSTFQRFDKFNDKYNLLGQYSLRTVFLRFDNYIHGQYLAEITSKILSDLERSKYQFAEHRLGIGGIKRDEWDILAKWVCDNNLCSTNIRWMIQVPRIYTVFKKYKVITSFHEMLSNLFEPLFESTIDPSSHPEIYLFLQTVTGFDSVDDESKFDNKLDHYPSPSQWTYEDRNPPYSLYLYYMYANIRKLNVLRETRNLNTFTLRPHAGETGSVNHLISSFLLSHSINHGIVLHDCPTLEYLFYINQIGLSLSPSCNNLLFKKYDENPFPHFFKRGLNVSLSTDDPLIIHYTDNALIEEYSTIAKIYNLSDIDLCEIARNSVLQCGWDNDTKHKWIGNENDNFNDIYLSNVPNIRLQFRSFTLNEEKELIQNR